MKSFVQTLSFLVVVAAFTFFSTPTFAQIHLDSSNDVGIGITSTASAKLRVYNNSNPYTLRTGNYYNTTGTKYGIYNYTGSQGTGTKYGIRNYVYQNSGSSAATYSFYNRVYPAGTGTAHSNYNYMAPNSNSTATKYGVYSYISSAGTGTRYGVYSNIAGEVGSYAGYFLGDVYISGVMTVTSDERTKKDVEDVEGALAMVRQLEGKSYNFKSDTDMSLPTGRQFGFMAQELEQVFPELVKNTTSPGTPIEDQLTEEEIESGDIPADKMTPETTFKSVNYMGMIPILVEAIKEQQDLIEQQQTEIEALKAAIRK